MAYNGIAKRIQTHLAYASVFDDVLTVGALISYCDPNNGEQVRHALRALEAQGLVRVVDGRCILTGGPAPRSPDTDLERRRHADAVLAANRRAIEFIRRLPWVRMLAISGSLARDNPRPVPGKDHDVDLFVIAAPDSVHLVRFVGRMLTVARRFRDRISGSGSSARLCLNYVTETTRLELTYKSLFTASEALHVRVIKGDDMYRRLLAANDWISEYYHLARLDTKALGEPERRRISRAALNWISFAALGVAQWCKSRIEGYDFHYGFKSRSSRPTTLRRAEMGGGGYQPLIAARFGQVYRENFGADEALEAFLFPGTTDAGVCVEGVHHTADLRLSLAFDE